jgi:hypothetical protein
MSYVANESIIAAPQNQVFKTLLKPSVYKKLVPESLELSLVGPEIPMRKGAEYEFKLVRWGIQQILSLRVEGLIENEEIVLTQSVGFFGKYRHTVRLSAHDESSTRISHFVEYELQFGLLGKLYDDLHLRRFLEKMLETCSQKIPSVVD